MDSVTGACSVDKVSGMVNVREDVTPSVLEWKAIDQSKSLAIPLNSLNNLQATKDGSPKMILKITYKPSGEPEKSIKLTFNNRPTMNNIKNSLQTIVARSRTIIKDMGRASGSAPGTPPGSAASETPEASSGDTQSKPGDDRIEQSSDSLSDASLLKNLQLQQKLLLEDRNLRNVFTQSVMNFKLSPTIFWSGRLNQLRTYALTISQHRGPYNVLSTIKPVATSDNQVNVNVTRDTINEIFDTYPIIKKAFKDLVPVKISEGEFWSRFFNSKLFRRLRGDKINSSNDRGDVVLDKYLYIDQDYLEDDEPSHKRHKPDHKVNKFIDVLGNEDDNSTKLGNRPDLTMRYTEDPDKQATAPVATRGSTTSIGQENEMIILMKNMNKLSRKMVNVSVENDENERVDYDQNSRELFDELNLHDLNEMEDPHYIKLNIDPHMENHTMAEEPKHASKTEPVDLSVLKNYIISSRLSPGPIDLTEAYRNKNGEIEKTTAEITQLIKQNYRTHKLITKEVSMGDSPTTNLVPSSLIQEIVTYNMTIVEFLSHFWKLFLGGNNPGQLKKLYVSLKNCQNDLNALRERAIGMFNDMDLVKNNEKLKDKMAKDFSNCVSPMEIGLQTACDEYVKAVRAEQDKEAKEKGAKEKEATEKEAKEKETIPV